MGLVDLVLLLYKGGFSFVDLVQLLVQLPGIFHATTRLSQANPGYLQLIHPLWRGLVPPMPNSVWKPMHLVSVVGIDIGCN